MKKQIEGDEKMIRGVIAKCLMTASFAVILIACEGKQETRKVTTDGFASAEYSADQVNVYLEIETKGENTSEAMDENKKSTVAAMKIIDAAGAFIKSAQKNTTQFGKKYNWDNGAKRREEYNATTIISFVAKDISKYDSISRLFADIPGTSIQSSNFSLSSEIEMRDAVRKTALKKAEEKAAFMADCLGMEIGHPLKIIEGQNFRAPMGPSAVMQNSVADMTESPSSGTISVEAFVEVEFEMTPK